MKKIAIVLSIFLIGMAGALKAQTGTPVVKDRQENQQKRIHQGVRSGELNASEAYRLEKQQRHIQRSKREAKSDGVVTPRERRRLEKQQNHANRNIRRQKHDRQEQHEH